MHAINRNTYVHTTLHVKASVFRVKILSISPVRYSTFDSRIHADQCDASNLKTKKSRVQILHCSLLIEAKDTKQSRGHTYGRVADYVLRSAIHPLPPNAAALLRKQETRIPSALFTSTAHCLCRARRVASYLTKNIARFRLMVKQSRLIFHSAISMSHAAGIAPFPLSRISSIDLLI